MTSRNIIRMEREVKKKIEKRGSPVFEYIFFFSYEQEVRMMRTKIN